MAEAVLGQRDEGLGDGADHTVARADVEPVNKAERRALYAKRVKIHPKLVHGTFRRLKWAILVGTLAIYYVTPWLRWDRGPTAPDQAVLIDIPARRFYFFFIEIWPQEVYYLTGLLILAAVSLFLVTSLAGRVWCGYTCPQTVWTDLFIAVERLVEGNRAARIRLDKAPWSAAKIAKRALKHAIWLVIGAGTGGAWVFYFADAPTLAANLLTFQAPTIAYISIAVLTATTYVFGGFAREQVCTYMCPWPRIQAGMLDEDSLVVAYREDRGEPRGGHKKGTGWDGRGHCVDCNQCVAACPMGIDIRDGQQLECITCALCIDACDNVMDRVGLPRGLIAYDTLANADRRARGEKPRVRLIRPRTVIYGAIIAGVGLTMMAALATRSDLDVNLLRDRNPLFVKLSDGSIRNGYSLKILNKAHLTRDFELEIQGLPAPRIRVVGQDPAGPLRFHVGPDRLGSFRVYVTVPPGTLDGPARDVRFVVSDLASGASVGTDSTFRGPER